MQTMQALTLKGIVNERGELCLSETIQLPPGEVQIFCWFLPRVKAARSPNPLSKRICKHEKYALAGQRSPTY